MASNVVKDISTMTRSFDVIVVGAGVAGCPTAVVLARQGKRVLLVERDLSEPDRIVGELLQPGGVDSLRRLGMEDTILGIDASPCLGYKVIIPGTEDKSAAPKPNNILRDVLLPYPEPKQLDPKDPEYLAPETTHGGKLPINVGQGFHHGRFITSLRKKATTTPGVTTLEGVVTSLITDRKTPGQNGKVKGVNVQLKGTDKEIQFYAPLTVVADGCFSKFRKDYIPTPIVIKGHFVGVEIKNCDLPNPGYGHVMLAYPSPVLLYGIGKYEPGTEPVEADGTVIRTETRALIDIPGTDIKKATGGDLKKYLEEKILPQMPDQVKPSFLRAITTSRLRTMPNQYLPAPSQHATFPPGLVFIGDSHNMRHPLTGGGMTVAFEDVVLFSQEMERLTPSDLLEDRKVRAAVKTWMMRRVKVSGVVNVLSMALYDLFAAGDDHNLRVLRDATFAYFEAGGNCVTGPVSLLAGILKSPFSLMTHFFSVALYGTWITVRKNGILYLPLSLITCTQVLWKASTVILPIGWKEGWNRFVAWR